MGNQWSESLAPKRINIIGRTETSRDKYVLVEATKVKSCRWAFMQDIKPAERTKNMTYEEALDYFAMAEQEGYSSLSMEELEEMTEEEVIKLAEGLGTRGDYYASLTEED